PNTAISSKMASIPNLPQGACLAQEVGGVGGETSGTARVGAGFAPDKSSSPAQRSCSSERGFGGSQPLSLHPLFPKPNPHTNLPAHSFRKKPWCSAVGCGWAVLSLSASICGNTLYFNLCVSASPRFNFLFYFSEAC